MLWPRLLSGGAVFALSFQVVWGASVSELSSKVENYSREIEALETEISKFQEELSQISKESETLSGAIKTLDVSRKKLGAEISLTERRINQTTLNINDLTLGIASKEDKINLEKSGMEEALRILDEWENQSLVEIFLAHSSWGKFFDAVFAISGANREFQRHAGELQTLKESLEKDRLSSEKLRANLQAYRRDLSYQKQLLDQNRAEKNQLLSDTKAKESEYQKLLVEKQKKRDAVAAELFKVESELRLIVDPGSYPSARKGILSWPLKSVFVTQYFGNTAFAQSGAYNGRGHNGVDFRATPGTPVFAALSGMVKGEGNTDSVCYGASYGKWVLIEHDNGLSTLYAHLSLTRVSAGQRVSVGETIGYSGSTGYATGPHLHFSVFATQGVRIQSFKSRVCRGAYILPVADLKAYLNPLSYL